MATKHFPPPTTPTPQDCEVGPPGQKQFKKLFGEELVTKTDDDKRIMIDWAQKPTVKKVQAQEEINALSKAMIELEKPWMNGCVTSM